MNCLIRLGCKIRKKFGIVVSYAFLAFSALICTILLFSDCFDRCPAVTYFANELKLPTTYELQGSVKILDDEGSLINKNVVVFVGGYNTTIKSSDNTEFELNFTSVITSDIYVVIQYEDIYGNTKEHTQLLKLDSNEHSLYEEYIIYD